MQTQPMPTFHVPEPGDRPDVRVEVDGVWLAGELRMWTQADDDTWSAQVQWRPGGTSTRRIDTFPQNRVRLDDGRGATA